MGTLNTWSAIYKANYTPGINSVDGLENFEAAIEHNRQLVRQWDQMADAQLARDAAFIGSTMYQMGTFTPIGGAIDVTIRAASGNLHWTDAAMLLPVVGKGIGTLTSRSAAAERGSSSLPVVFDGEFATQQLLGTTTTPVDVKSCSMPPIEWLTLLPDVLR